MSGIDWSKAPADATHARTHRAGVDFYKLNGEGDLEYWVGQSHWAETLGTRLSDCVPRPVQWNGEGLPPVGTACEIRLNNGLGNWCKATILFCQDNALVLAWAAEGVAHATTLDQVEIRPTRTAEQIAEEEREKAIAEILEIVGSDWRNCAAALIDAGYVKP